MSIAILYLSLGAVAGLLAGLLGVGGGLIIVPGFLLLFAKQGFSSDVIMHMAVGTSLATIVVTSLSSIRAHHRHKAVAWPVLKELLPGIIVGGLFGAFFADLLTTVWLKVVFGLFVLAAATQMALKLKTNPSRVLPGHLGLFGAGGAIGGVSSLVGVGGGVLTVPFLVWCNTPIRQAVGTSAACGLPIAVTGSFGFMVMGLNEVSVPAFTTGYVYWPACFGVVLASVCFAPLGALVAHKIPSESLRRLFSLFLIIIGARMVFFA